MPCFILPVCYPFLGWPLLAFPFSSLDAISPNKVHLYVNRLIREYIRTISFPYRTFSNCFKVAPPVFNKASLMNAGFKEIVRRTERIFDCYIFHDIDTYPENDRNFYGCYKLPKHVAGYVDKLNYGSESIIRSCIPSIVN